MTPQELKNSILQLAIQGKLVEQRPEEGTAEELFAQIQQEKQRLIAEKKIKKEKPLPEITDDEKPFDIPVSWKWIRLGELIRVIGGVSYKKGAVCSSGIRILRGGNIQSMKIIISDDDVFLPFDYEESEKQIRTGDILIVASTGSKTVIGKAGYVDREYPNTMIGAFLRICRPIYMPTVKYLRCLFDTDFYRRHIRELSQGTNINNVKESYITEFVIPLPPLSEQKRIVAKIEELLPYIDRYEQTWSKLEQFNSRFPEEMKKSLLQYAIQGKLVEQRPEEGTAEELFAQIQQEKQRLIAEKKIKKEKPLTEITDDEKPFDIPESWKWVRFSDVIDVRDGTHDTPKYVTKGIPLVTSKNLVSGGIDFDTTKLISEEDAVAINMRSEVNTGDILFAMIGTIGNPVLVKKDREFCIKNMALFKPIAKHLFDMSYLLLFLQKEQEQMKKNASGGVQSFVSLKFLRNYMLPLPPLAEQKRIVEKMEQLLPLCERLK